ncbi:N-acetylglucosamine-6-phosphate deacetylase [Mucilaginibacter aquariorum]|uniref:N-acetylglucosamine-6-phosphate deacetylase n=1 Tax=Mucilaginibacter aquariorum TaxID=2967225 RepID=A0ABT1SYA0_9SPHI|nr:N-acetylglucosamine-6-phosphate deacetylase [Mucilaginibacter aquariorum]MCQ6957193.1 N-acetylglucosamine-6-phosphate deacetylase [Mucilaginibacter aquariorum]
MDSSDLKIINARIITPTCILNNGSLLVHDGTITAISEGEIEGANENIIDAGGKYLSPGFIDIHVHGGGGHDFMDNTVNAYLEIAKLHASHGTTSFTPTTLSCEKDALLKTLSLYEESEPLNIMGSNYLGMHIEGPYFSMEQRGAQDPRFIRLPDPQEYKEILQHSSIVKRWSAAPEVNGAVEFGRFLVSKGILPSIAHTDAIYEEVLEAYESGYTHITHFYSCMSGVSRRNAFRYAGVVESGYLLDDMTVEIIADGIHLPPPLLKLVYKIKGPDKIALVTDAMRAAGMPPGESILGGLEHGLKVIVEDNVAKLPDRSAFAGSVATTIQLVRNMINLADVPLIDAIRMMTITPAKIMGADDKKGSIVIGKDADLVIFDDNINLHKTIIGGRVVHSA